MMSTPTVTGLPLWHMFRVIPFEETASLSSTLAKGVKFLHFFEHQNQNPPQIYDEDFAFSKSFCTFLHFLLFFYSPACKCGIFFVTLHANAVKCPAYVPCLSALRNSTTHTPWGWIICSLCYNILPLEAFSESNKIECNIQQKTPSEEDVFLLCAGWDSNSHDLATTTPSK